MTEHTVIVVVIVCVAVLLIWAMVTRPGCEQVVVSVIGDCDVQVPRAKLTLHRPAVFELASAP
jgi:hypothetical protein